jgi:hypothetical protein
MLVHIQPSNATALVNKIDLDALIGYTVNHNGIAFIPLWEQRFAATGKSAWHGRLRSLLP